MPSRPTCICRECRACKNRERVRRWQRENPQKRLAKDRRYRERHPAKIRARQEVRLALRRGTIERGPCTHDGPDCAGSIEAHHPDHSKPLEVEWLCSAHHWDAEHAEAA